MAVKMDIGSTSAKPLAFENIKKTLLSHCDRLYSEQVDQMSFDFWSIPR